MERKKEHPAGCVTYP